MPTIGRAAHALGRTERSRPENALAGAREQTPRARSRAARRIFLRHDLDAGAEPRSEQPSRGDERRATRRALEDWKRLHVKGRAPALSDLAPHRAAADWADRFLLACDSTPARSVFVLCGGHIEAAFGERLIGRALIDVAPRHGALLEACGEAVRLQAPIEVEDGCPLEDGRILIYRAVFLPIRGADHEYGYLMGAYGCFAVAP